MFNNNTEADDDSHRKLRFIKTNENIYWVRLLQPPTAGLCSVTDGISLFSFPQPSQDYVISVSCQIRPLWLVSGGHVTGWSAQIGCNYQGSYDWWGLQSEWEVQLGDLLEHRERELTAHTDIIITVSSVLCPLYLLSIIFLCPVGSVG